MPGRRQDENADMLLHEFWTKDGVIIEDVDARTALDSEEIGKIGKSGARRKLTHAQ